MDDNWHQAWRVWQEHTTDPACLSLIRQYLHYSTEQGGMICPL